MDHKQFLSVSEAARILGVSAGTVRTWGRKGILREHRLPTGHRRFLLHDVQEVCREREPVGSRIRGLAQVGADR